MTRTGGEELGRKSELSFLISERNLIYMCTIFELLVLLVVVVAARK